jgi:bacterioferritin-associated ferredoxin
MTQQQNPQEDIIICDCAGTTEAKIQQLIDDGIDNLDRISRITGAASGCGACDILIEEMLEK